MITRLELQDFGKFRKKAFDFSPFTVVLGANESGKTTIFDAIFECVCEGSRDGKKVPWKNQIGRYGGLRKAAATWAGDPVELGTEEFLEIFAIRAGDASVNAAGGESWQTAAEEKLLNSGLNPAGIGAALIKRGSPKSRAQDSLQGRINELNARLAALQPELDALKARRDSIFAGEVETARLEGELSRQAAALEARQAELKGLNGRLEGLRESAKLRDAEEGLKALREHGEVSAKVAGLAAFAKNELPEYRAIMAERQERERAASSAEAALKERKAAEDAARAAALQLADREPALKRQVETAAALLARLNAFASAPPKVIVTVVKPMRYGIWAGALALAAFVAFSGKGVAAYAAAAAIVGAGAWIGLKLSLKQELKGPSEAETKAFLDGLGVDWAMVSAEPLPGDIPGAQAACAKPAADHAALVEAYNQRAQEIGDLEAGLAPLRENLADFRKDADAAAARAAAWLKERGCDDEEAYEARRAEYEQLSTRLADLDQRVKVFLLRCECETQERLKNRLLDDKDLLEKRGVESAKADDKAAADLARQAEEAAREVHNMEAEAAVTRSRLEVARGIAGAKLEGIPERLNALENELAAAREEIAEAELRQQACMLAGEVFNKLAEKSTLAFETLAKETAALLSSALPGVAAEFGSFDAEKARVRDAGGDLREIKYLSSGTRDLFMLGARLLMARRARTGVDGKLSPALLVLDDPFYTLDPERELSALKLLAAFHKETGWQMIVFTKDEGLAQAALGIGAPVRLVELK